MDKDWLRTLKAWCKDLAECDPLTERKRKQIEEYIVASAMLAAGYEWSTEEDRYIRSK